MGGHYNWCIPIEAVFHVFWFDGKVESWIGLHILWLICFPIQHVNIALIASAKNKAGVVRIKCKKCRLATSTCGPITLCKCRSIVSACDNHGWVVLLATIYLVRKYIVCIHSVKLCGRLIHDAWPGFSIVETYFSTPIIAKCDDIIFTWIDPEIMGIAVLNAYLGKCFAAINGFHHRGIKHINDVFIDRICKYFHVIPRAWANVLVIG